MARFVRPLTLEAALAAPADRPCVVLAGHAAEDVADITALPGLRLIAAPLQPPIR